MNYERHIVISDTEKLAKPVIKSAKTLDYTKDHAQLGDIGDNLLIFYRIFYVIFLYHILYMCIFTLLAS